MARIRALAWLALSLHGAVVAGSAPAAGDDIAAFDEYVARLESAGGPYNPMLTEALMALGRVQRQAGLDAAAAGSLERALHVARVNAGLHNPAHIPLLESLLEVHGALGDAEAVDRDYQQIYWIRLRNAGADRAALLPLIMEIGAGRLRAHAGAPAAAGLAHLVKADAIYDLARRIDAETRGGAGTDLYYHAALANHRLALEMRATRIGFHELRAALIGNGRAVSEVNEEQARETLFTEFYLKGEWLAKQAVERTASAAAPLAHAESLRFLGDYYLSFRRNFDAMQEYRRALDVLARHGLGSHAERLFGTPEPVALLRAPGDAVAPGVMPAHGQFVEVLLDIGADGWPHNVRVQRSGPDAAADLAQRGARALLARQYRPRLEQGRPVPTENIPARYDFPP